MYGLVCPHVIYADAEFNTKLVFHTAWRQRDAIDPAFAAAEDSARRFLAPETAGTGAISTASDVYSFGLFLWQVYHPSLAVFAEVAKAEDLAARVKAGGSLPPLAELPVGTAVGIINVFAACGHVDPPQRPDMVGVAEVLRDEVKGADRWNVSFPACTQCAVPPRLPDGRVAGLFAKARRSGRAALPAHLLRAAGPPHTRGSAGQWLGRRKEAQDDPAAPPAHPPTHIPHPRCSSAAGLPFPPAH